MTIEVSIGGLQGVPRILGLADAGVREALFRILGALKAQDLPLPSGVPTISLTPATIRKSGSGFDLPMALAMCGAGGYFEILPCLAALGEVSLGGDILPAPGIIAVAMAARERGWTHLLTDPSSAPIAALVPGIQAYGAATLGQAFAWLRGKIDLIPAVPQPAGSARAHRPTRDLIDIRGHETPKQALMVAAAGRHNLLLVGPPGSGKSALAQRLPGILPPTSDAEALEILKIHTVRSTEVDPFGRGRPVRCPHHTSSAASLLGGGPDPRPGEVSLAQHGVLFLDELPEFRREVIEGLRQPLEDGELTIGRARQTVTMPAEFLLVCAMNPCPCGHFGDTLQPCTCSPSQRQRYRARISGPLLDRLDLQIEVPNVSPETYNAPRDPNWSSERLAERVAVATARQLTRGSTPNGRLEHAELEAAVGNDPSLHRTLATVLRTNRLSGRSRVRLLRLARTLADLDDRDEVRSGDLLLAARLRGATRQSLG